VSDRFVHLKVASGYSLQHGASHPYALVERAVEHEMDSLALTDRNGVYGAVRFVKACAQAGIRPILGVDLAFSHTAPAVQRTRTPARGGAFRDRKWPRVTFLANGAAGWAAVCRLVSAVHAEGRTAEVGDPVVTLDLVKQHLNESVIVLLGPDSPLGQIMVRRRPDLAVAELHRWREVVARDQLIIDVVSHRLPGSGIGTSAHAARMLGFARAQRHPVVLTNAVRYADRLDAPIVDVLDAARRLVPMDARHLDRGNAEGYLKSGKQMDDIAEEICRMAGSDSRRDVAHLLGSTRKVADRCALDPRGDLGLGEVHFPVLTQTEVSADQVLRERCEAKVGSRYGNQPRQRIWKRLDDELSVIAHLGYASYFLTVGEVTDIIANLGIRSAARGSGAGSLVNYLLGVSGVDPIRHGLLMERFLSPLRQSLPDVDLDVESARRLEVYDAIFERFGKERTACVSMMETYRVRHAIRDVGAALGMPLGEIDTIAKAFPHIRARDARMAMRDLPELRGAGLDADQFQRFFGLVERLDGLPRHIAMHPCGVILSDHSLLNRTPVESSFMGYPMSQFDKDDVEDLGLLKLDVLGIRMQSAMAHAVAEIHRTSDIEVDLDDHTQVPFDDQQTYAMISSAKTLGVFQIESPGQRELVGKSGIEDFADIIADISLFRPGPVKSDMITPYLEAKQGWKMPRYLHDDLRPILGQTRGVVVYHEQVIEMIAAFTGCSFAEGDEARRALGDVDGMAATKAWFFPRALARGYQLGLVEQIWKVIESFASFGFCKAHAAAFALPTFQSAWLKTHWPAHFLAGVLTHDPGMYPKRLILDDARQLGIEVLGLDVNRSEATYSVEKVDAGWGIRVALAEVKGITTDEVAQIVASRPYHSLSDLWRRAGASRPTVERLVLAGGLDSVYDFASPSGLPQWGRVTRRDLLLQIAELERFTKATMKSVAGPDSVQMALDLGDSPGMGELSGLPEMSATDRVRAELDVLGLDASSHVLSSHQRFLDRLGVVRSAELLNQRPRVEILVAGVKVATQTPPMKSGRRVIFLTLDDATGPVDATFFADVQDPYATTVFGSWLVVVRGVVRRTGRRGISLRATGAWDLGHLSDLADREGIEAVWAHIAASRALAPGDRPERVLVHTSGFRMSPYADIKPAGISPSTTGSEVARKLWHRSPGSAG